MRQIATFIRSRLDEIMSSNSRTVQAFKTIAGPLTHRPTLGDVDAAYRLIRSHFRIEKLAIDHLALILTNKLSWDQVHSIPGILSVSKNASDETMDALVNKGFIRKTQGKTIIFEEEFMFAASKDIPFLSAIEPAQYESFVKMASEAFIPKLTDYRDELDQDDSDSFPMPDPGIPRIEIDEQFSSSDVAERIIRMLDRHPDTRFAQAVFRVAEGLSSEECGVLFVLMGFFAKNFIDPLQPGDITELRWTLSFHRAIGNLLKKGLIVSLVDYIGNNDKVCKKLYRISPRCAEVFHGHEEIINYSQLSESGTFTPKNFIQKKELFFPERLQKSMDRLRRASSQEHHTRIVNALNEKGLRACVSAILAGSPGTGKTELAYQIARETGRGLFCTDASKLYGTFWGESERAFRNLFQSYRYLCAVSEVCPILFMDEADGILASRIRATTGLGKSENVVQNIILEEPNTMPGVFIATTNLLENVDRAMLRRFMVKMEFNLPDESTRAHLWHARFPNLPDEAVATLAADYEISGGLIDNVASMAVIDAIIDDRDITVDDLVSYCEEQGYGLSSRNRIGF